jgi:hypothetical protein
VRSERGLDRVLIIVETNRKRKNRLLKAPTIDIKLQIKADLFEAEKETAKELSLDHQ